MKPNLPMREKNMRTEKETFEEEIAKGEKKLADAKEQIKKIKNPNGMYTIEVHW